MNRKLVVGLVAAVIAGVACADDFTWTGGAGDGCVSTPGNWTVGGAAAERAPKSGDNLIFNSAATIVAEDLTIAADETLTVTVKSGVEVTSALRPTGEGKFVKEGAGAYIVKCANNVTWAHTGGIDINNGVLKVNTYVSGATSAIGPSTITINRTEEIQPVLYSQNNAGYYGDIVVTGPYVANKQSLEIDCNQFTLNGSITCTEDDLMYMPRYGKQTINGKIDMGEHTIRFMNAKYYQSDLVLNGEVIGSLQMGRDGDSYALREISFGSKFRMLDPTATITCEKIAKNASDSGSSVPARVVFNSGSLCAASLNVSAQCTKLEVNDPKTFVGVNSVTIADSEKTTVSLASGVDIKTKSFTLDGVATTGTTAFGNGSITVVDEIGAVAVCRDTDGTTPIDWNAAANWVCNIAPVPGAIVYFTKETVLDETTFDFGEKGITIVNSGKLHCSVKFSGSGALTKDGAGQMYLLNGASSRKATSDTTVPDSKTDAMPYYSTYTGGTYILDGILNSQAGNKNPSSRTHLCPLGTNMIHIVRSTGKAPTLRNRSGFWTYMGKISVEGPDVAYPSTMSPIMWNNNGSFAIEATDDFRFGVDYGTMTITSLTAPGHKVVFGLPGWIQSDVIFTGTVDASVEVGTVADGASSCMRDLKFTGTSMFVDPGATIHAVRVVNVTFETGAQVYGSFVNDAQRSSSAGTYNDNVKIMGSDIFQGPGTLTVDRAEQITLANGATVRVTKLTVGENEYTEGEQALGGGTVILAPFEKTIWLGRTTDWQEAENWYPTGVPAVESDSVVLFPKRGTAWKVTASEPVDLTGGSVTIENASEVQSHVKFTGSGKLIKEGEGQYSYGADGFVLAAENFSDHTGGTDINDGTIYTYSAAKSLAILGTGDIYVNRTAGKYPCLYSRSGSGVIFPNIRITGEYVADHACIDLNGYCSYSGAIYAEDDFEIWVEWGEQILPAIHAPGHNVIVRSANTWASGQTSTSMSFRGELDCNLVLGQAGKQFGYTTFWNNVVLKGSLTTAGTATEVRVTAAKLFSETTSIALSEGTTLKIAEGIVARVPAATLGATVLKTGRYTKADYPAYLTGDGTLHVGAGLVLLVY